MTTITQVDPAEAALERATAIGLMRTWYEGSVALGSMGPYPLIEANERGNTDQWQRAMRHAKTIIEEQRKVTGR